MPTNTSVTYKNVNPEIGIYGAYNPFVAIIGQILETPVFNLTYKVKVTPLNNPSNFLERNITPIGVNAVVEPFELVKDTFFESSYGGWDELQLTSFSIIRIEVGASFSGTSDVAPTFEGYLVSNEFYVYNGYENQPVEINYRDFYWYSFAPIKLPKVKKDVALLANDTELLSYPTKFRGFYDGLDSILTATNVLTDFYRSNNTLISGSSINEPIDTPSNVAYFKKNINLLDFSIPAAAAYWKVRIRYTNVEEEVYDSEEIKVSRAACNPKQSNHRLYWVNRYGGDEYQNFTMLSDTNIQISKGKRIQSDGINYKATNFEDVKNINNPNIQEFGNSVSKNITLRSDYLRSQEEVDALAELYKSAVVIMFDDEGTHPMIVTTSSYKIVSVQQELYKVEVNLQYANNELMQIQ
jgi:hypothetical protein